MVWLDRSAMLSPVPPWPLGHNKRPSAFRIAWLLLFSAGFCIVLFCFSTANCNLVLLSHVCMEQTLMSFRLRDQSLCAPSLADAIADNLTSERGLEQRVLTVSSAHRRRVLRLEYIVSPCFRA